jgi:hypothetical protein
MDPTTHADLSHQCHLQNFTKVTTIRLTFNDKTYCSTNFDGIYKRQGISSLRWDPT